MGGGDLNLKKSWHPQTLKNIERVWKAEQRHEAECKKIEELQKELREERAREEITRYAQETGTLKKKDDRLDWMYQGPGGSVSRDEYLLGRPIDKQITQQYEEPESGPSAQTGLLPGSIFNTSSPVSTLDLAAKIREDPLFAIRKREEEKKRKVLTNPVKMKMIKDMLRQNLEKEEEEKKKKKRKKAAAKKKRKEQYKRHSTSAESLSLEKKEPRFRHRECTPPDTSKAGYGLQLPAKGFHHTLGTSGQQRNHTKDRSRSCSPHRSEINNGSFHTSNKKPLGRYSNISSQSQENHGREKDRGRQGTSRTKCLSAQERERKRQEMMDFARQRDEERVNNIQKYRRQEEQKKDRDGKSCHHAAFIHDMKLESAATSSLADRVKRNIHSLQRTPAALEKSFMKR